MDNKSFGFLEYMIDGSHRDADGGFAEGGVFKSLMFLD